MKTLLTFRKGAILLFLMLISVVSFAQNGSIKGTITDDSGAPLMDANIAIPKIEKGATTDWDGNYEIGGIPAGNYTIYINLIGFKPDTIKNFQVKSGESAELTRKLAKAKDSDEIDLDIVVVGEKEKGTVAAVIEEIKQSEEVVTAIPQEQMNKSQDRNAADVMRRIPGVSIIDNRFVIVRGLNQRYNSVMLNGVIAPSTEPDSRAFSFDVIQSRLLERIMVYKSGSPELPGEFAGAIVKLYTKNSVDSNFCQFNLTGGYRFGTSFKRFYQPAGGKTDFLGIDNGTRALPSDFPDTFVRGIYGEENAKYAKMLPDTWQWRRTTALPDLRTSLDIGRKWEKGDRVLSNLTSLGYTNSNTAIESEIQRFDRPVNGNRNRESYFLDSTYVNNVNISLIHNWRYQANGKNIYEFRNLLNQWAIDEFISRKGVVGPEDNLQFERKDYGLHFVSRRIYSGQLQGSHDFNKQKSNFTWVAGYTNISRNEPDYRRARTQKAYGSDAPYQVIIPYTGTTFDAATFYSKLNENTYAFSGDFSHKIPKNDTVNIELKAGIYSEYKSRDFSARWFSYARSVNFADSLQFLPIDQLFTDKYINPRTGLTLEEGTNSSDKYDASYNLNAAYLSLSYPLMNWNFSGGLRLEYFNQKLNSSISQSQIVNVDTTAISPLPFVNVAYNFNKKTLIRLAYSRTINRPYFRELAPFSYYDFINSIDVAGNPNLQSSTINNFDARWEIYPSAGEFVALGVFYKDFRRPIETVLGGNANPVFTFSNAENANAYGVEVEVRKSFGKIVSGESFLNRFGVLFNGALIRSRVDFSNDSTISTSIRERPLQGQSPYILNTGLFYDDPEKGLIVSVLYNVSGKRIFLVGDNNNPTVFELPRHEIDLTVKKRLGTHWQFNLGINDLLNSSFRFYQDIDEDLETDYPWRTWRRGQYLTAGITFTW